MAKLDQLPVQGAVAELLQGLGSHSEDVQQSLYDLAVRTKDLLAAKGVVDEVRRRLLELEAEAKAGEEVETQQEEILLQDKRRAAAWAWYQHSNGAVIPQTSASSLSRRGCPHRKDSRFKIEALRVGNNGSNAESRWDFEYSLFDSYELDSVSKRIDSAFQERPLLPQEESPSPLPLPSTKAKVKSRNLGISIPRLCRRTDSDVVTHKEMAALGWKKTRTRETRGGVRSSRSFSEAVHVLVDVSSVNSQCVEEQPPRHSKRHDQHQQHHYSLRLKGWELLLTTAMDGLELGDSVSPQQSV